MQAPSLVLDEISSDVRAQDAKNVPQGPASNSGCWRDAP